MTLVARMIGWIGTTDFDWYSYLHAQGALEEVNFWQPSGGKGFHAIGVGAPFFFKLKAPHNVIAGFGIFAGHTVLPAWLAWESFGTANGAPDFPTMRQRIEKYRHAPPDPHATYQIGCLMIAQPVFFDRAEWISQPTNWGRQTVQGARIDLTAGEGRRIWDACLARASASAEGYPVDPSLLTGPPRFGREQIVRPRLGQGIFRIAVTDAYNRACAVTTEHSLPVLEAAHIKPYAQGGRHDISNGLLLRTDLHRLFDRGYVTVTPDHRLAVSRRLRDDFENGKVYYAMQGTALTLPTSPQLRPAEGLLVWHNEKIFLGI